MPQPDKNWYYCKFWKSIFCINSAANFLLYMVKGEKFRDAFCQTYFSCKSSNVLPNHSTNLTMTSRTNSISIRKNYSTKNEINWNYTFILHNISYAILIWLIWSSVPYYIMKHSAFGSQIQCRNWKNV